MESITAQEACEAKGMSHSTLRKAVKRGLLTPEYRNESRNGYTRRIIYVIKDEKYDNYFPRYIKKQMEESNIIVVKSTDDDAWIFRNDAMGKECAGLLR